MFKKVRGNTRNDGTSQPEDKGRSFRWIAFVVLVLCVFTYFPSIASLAFLVAALMICPVKRIRELDFMRRMNKSLASLGLSTNRAINIAATVLFLLGAVAVPNKSETTRSASKPADNGLLSVTKDIEYSHDPVDVFEYVVCSDEDAKLEATDDVVASEVGTHVVTFKISRGLLRNSKEDVELVVRDTQAPTIEFAEDVVEITAGDAFDPSSNIQMVEDPVDGELPEVREEPSGKEGEVGLDRLYDEGWYLVDSVDTSEVGEKEVTVIAADQHGNETTDSFELIVTDPFEGIRFKRTTKTIEYSNKKLDPTKLVTCSDPEATVAADKISLNKVGAIKVTYTLTKGDASKQVQKTFRVVDTKKPRISINQGELSIEQGESFDPYDNVKSVEDEVDGPLERMEEEPKDNGDGWYTIDGHFDVDKPSKYYFTVIACDRNGNRTTKEFSLLVKDPPVQETSSPDQENAVPTHDYVVNTNTGKFHYPSCYDVKRMNESNKWFVTTTRDDLVGRGYSPCGHCNP